MAPIDYLSVPKNFDTPIEHLFKAMYTLQWVPECEEEYNSLKAKLEKEFENIPEKDMRKIYRGIEYCPNGLCCSDSFRIVLSPWEVKEETIGEKTSTFLLNELKYQSRFWYQQVRTYLKRRIVVLPHDKIELANTIAFADKFRAASDEEKQLIEVSTKARRGNITTEDMMKNEFYSILSKLSALFSCNYYRSLETVVLNEDLIKHFVSICNLYKNDKWRGQKHMLESAQDIRLRSGIKLGIELAKKKDTTCEEICRAAYAKFLEIEDENVKAVLKKYGII